MADFAGLQAAPRLANAATDDINALRINEEELALSKPIRKCSKNTLERLQTPTRAAQASTRSDLHAL